MTPVSILRETLYNQTSSDDKNKGGTRMNPRSRTSGQQGRRDIAQDIAAEFVDARRRARALPDFPGTVPAGLDDAYRIQDIAIELWRRPIGGWKVGRIPVDLETEFGTDRLGGPIFAPTIHRVEAGTVVEMPVFAGGFAAVEAEFVAMIGKDVPPGQRSWTLDEAREVIADLRIGLEIASSPLATINELGPAVVVSDFGNNFGLIVGPSIADWESRALDTMRCCTRIDGQVAGDGGAFKLTGGFVRSVQFLLELTARRGLPLHAGDVIATGQTTGIHDIAIGQTGTVDFGDDGTLSAVAVAIGAKDERG